MTWHHLQERGIDEITNRPEPPSDKSHNKPNADRCGSTSEPTAVRNVPSSNFGVVKSETKGFKCGKCPKGFKSRHELRKHEAKIHRIYAVEYVCPICDGKHKYRTNFHTHLRKPSQKCLRMRPKNFDYLSVDIDENTRED
ncbi:putative zinc finger protein [Orchesella cincta]|uniref:Putative zinc finger protein n=1 Tax=Orchesella cincta TaxID=48709 RepID=A0A1D2MBP4_ORCCI|nr:putative zinc finger protein [Orchesella cincta]